MKLDVVRLDSGDQSPTLATSARLAQRLRLEFHIDVTRPSVNARAAKPETAGYR